MPAFRFDPNIPQPARKTRPAKAPASGGLAILGPAPRPVAAQGSRPALAAQGSRPALAAQGSRPALAAPMIPTRRPALPAASFSQLLGYDSGAACKKGK